MQVGDLVRNIFTGELGLVTGYAADNPGDYVEVISLNQEWLVPIEHLELINKTIICNLDT